MDASITRRGQPCWYQTPDVGLIAINDAFMLKSAINYLIKSHFKQETYYVDVLELFLEVTYQTETGQLIDLITAPEDHVDLSKFNLNKHRLIVIYKTAFYSFYLPVALAMYMAKIPQSYPSPNPSPNYPAEIKPYDIALSILLDIGEYFQIQDDFLDYAIPPEELGKVGTDILDNKCSWVINIVLAILDTRNFSESASVTPPSYALSSNEAFKTAHSKISPSDKLARRAVLNENYGRKDKEKEARVKDIFNGIGVKEIYGEYEEGIYAKLIEKIDGIPEGEGLILRRDVFKMFLNKIYKRQK
jgi:farnesyl diphosphate synthase